MSSRTRTQFVALCLVLAATAILTQVAGAATADASSDRPLRHPLMLGAGATWMEPQRYSQSLYPGAMLGFDLGLGKHASIGLMGDVTFIDHPVYGRRDHVFTGLDVKWLPVATGAVRPWVMGGLALAFVNDTGFGFGVGAGAFIVPSRSPLSFFVDLRRYHIGDFENPSYNQLMLRAGVAY